MRTINRHDLSFKGHIALLSANIIFGINASFSKVLLNDHLSPYALFLLRVIGAAALFWFVSLFIKREKIDKKDFFILFVASVFGIILNQGFFVIGLSKSSPIDAILLQTLIPLITLLLAFFHLKEPITLKKAGGVIIGCAGAIFLILRNSQMDAGSGTLEGNIFILLGSLAYAIYLTFFLQIIRKYSPVTVMKWLFLFAAIICTPIWYSELETIEFAAFTSQTYFFLLFVIVGATFLSYLLIPIGQRNLRPTLVSMYIYGQPIVVSFVAIYLGVGKFTWNTLFAAILIFLGVYLVTMSKSRQQQLEEEKQKAQKSL